MSIAIEKNILADIASGDNLFSLPGSMQLILSKLNDERIPIDELAQAIQLDPALSATVLRVANSPYYHKVSKVRDLSQAVMTLGALKVKTIALTATILDPKHLKAISGINPIELVANSINVAVLAHKIAEETNYPRPEDAMMVGMLHDLGTLYLLNSHSASYQTVVKLCKKGHHLLEAEEKIFGADHARIGQALAETWNLPQEIASAIGTHHGASSGVTLGDAELNSILRLSAAVVGDQHIKYRRDIGRDLVVVRELTRKLGISDDCIQELMKAASDDSEQLAKEFSINISSVESLIVRANKKLGDYLSALERLLLEREELSERAMIEERKRASAEARVETVAALSDQINNAAMIILGRAEMLNHTLKSIVPKDKLSQIQSDLKDMYSSVHSIKSALSDMSVAGDLSAVGLKRIKSGHSVTVNDAQLVADESEQ